MTLTYPKGGKALLAGDWHGATIQSYYALDYAAKNDIDTIIQLGDFGFWSTQDPFILKTQRKAAQLGITVYWIDGNHEHIPRLLALPLDPETGLRPITENIIHLPRNFRWEWDGISFLALGGAQSIDEGFRVPGRDFFPEERITQTEAYTAMIEGKANVMFTHDAPSTIPNPITDDPYGQAQAAKAFGEDILAKCKSHQDLLSAIVSIVRPEYLFHGHYHLRQFRRYRHHGLAENPAYGICLDQGTSNGNPANLFTLELDQLDIEENRRHAETS